MLPMRQNQSLSGLVRHFVAWNPSFPRGDHIFSATGPRIGRGAHLRVTEAITRRETTMATRSNRLSLRIPWLIEAVAEGHLHKSAEQSYPRLPFHSPKWR
jgi:hypothetical protein